MSIIKSNTLDSWESKYGKKYIIVFRITLICVTAGVFYTFITTPYTGDIQVLMAGVNQVKYQNTTGLLAIFEAWDMKGIINRVILYIVYRGTLIFVEYGNVYAFMVVSKIIYGILALIVIVFSAWLLPIEKKNKVQFGFITYFTVFATFTASHMQAEMSVVLMCILVFSLLLGESKTRMIVAGIIGSLFLFTKSILVLLFFSALACVVLAKNQINFRRLTLSVISFSLSEVVMLVSVYVIYPKELVEMKNAAAYQTTLLSTGSNVPLLTILGNFINNYVQSCIAIPFLILGLVCSIKLLHSYIKNNDIVRIFAIIIAWILPIDMIVISNCYFIYHYFTLVLPCIVTIYVYLTKQDEPGIVIYYIAGVLALVGVFICWLLKDGVAQVSFLNYSTVLLVLIHLTILGVLICKRAVDKRIILVFEVLVLTVVVFFYANYSSFISPKYVNLIAMTKSSAECMKHFPDDFGDEPVLLLDPGTVTFYNDAKSYSEYFYNLPMARWSEGKNWEVQRNEYEKLMNYTGKYIVYSSWFGVDKYPEFQKKINDEYMRLEKSGYWTYSATWNVFLLNIAPEKNTVYDWVDSCIYVRKDGL